MKKQRSMTAAELVAYFERDPEFVEKRKQREKIFAEKEANSRAEQAELSAELCEVGIQVTSAWDLLPITEPYPEAIPILINHLQKPYSDGVLEGIARALTVREAVPYWQLLVNEYLNKEDLPRPLGLAKDGLACAIGGITDYNNEEMMKIIIDILKDKRHGSSRVLLLRLVQKSSLPIVKAALRDLVQDPQLDKEILSWK